MSLYGHLIGKYHCYLCGGDLGKINNTLNALAVQLGERSGDPNLAEKADFKCITKPHLYCKNCGVIICRRCRPGKTSSKWSGWPNCPKCGLKMSYL